MAIYCFQLATVWCFCSSRAGSLLGLCANVVCLLSVMLQSYMPVISQQIQDQLQVSVKRKVKERENNREGE